jgi:hypothetical protein
MTAVLSEEQQRELQLHGNQPVPVVHPRTQQTYFLVPGDLYARFRSLLSDEPIDISETYAAQEMALAHVWDDPELDVYNHYELHHDNEPG